MFKKKKTNILISFTVLASLLAFNFVLFPVNADEILTEEEEASMQQQIQELQEKIDKYRQAIIQHQQQGQSLENEISILNDQISRAELEIQRTNLSIQELKQQIAQKEEMIREIERRVDLEKTALSELIREISMYDDVSTLEIILGREKLSDFLSELRALENFQDQIQATLVEIYKLKDKIEEEKMTLQEQKEEQVGLRIVQEEQKIILESKKAQKRHLLEQTKGQEELYAQLVSKTRQDIEAIKNRLYQLKGITTDGELRFEDAYKFAKFASIYTGIRPAFLLAILSRESGLGKNVGTGTWRVDMKPSQRPYFLQICEKLGLDPDQQPVSKKVWYGWGGAMGPAQFIPTTWLGYEQRVAQITGNNPPSPWNVKDAFTASALYLVNKGADQQTYYAEWKAAMMYLAGSNWDKPYLAFYGDQVMALATEFQKDIDALEQK
ncbi:MAG: hypothetical protein GF387_00950 [Candidatus Portnoybacteria bacterium]|nr:hypothetical protein [Candidatus Portnoybacteria bacterium]